MDTKPLQQQDRAQELRSLDAKAASTAWEDRLAAINLIQAILRDLPTEQTLEHVMMVLETLANDQKWEVRKAVTPVLADIGLPGGKVIDRLAGDGNRWVRQAAERAKRKLAKITTPAEKRDRRSEFAFDLIKDLKAASPEKIYDVAIRIGEQYYEELAGDTAHELNTFRATLDILLTELEHHVVADKDGSQGAQEVVTKIRALSKSLKTLVTGMLEYAREADLTSRPEPLKPMVAEALNLARDKARALVGNLVVQENVLVADQLVLEVCRPRIVQALTNVISNALEAMAKGEEGAVLEVTATPMGTNKLVLTVKDTGCGMDSSQVENAKKRFRSLKKEQGGIGLGLPLALKIIQKEHGGRLDIDSELGVGTTVTIELPIKRDAKE